MIHIYLYPQSLIALSMFYWGLPWWLSGKESVYQCRIHGFNPWVRKIPRRRKWQLIPVFLPGKSPRQRSLAGYIQSMESQRIRHNWATKQPPFVKWQKIQDHSHLSFREKRFWSYCLECRGHCVSFNMFVNQGRFCPAGDTGNVWSHFWLSRLGGCAPLGSSEDRAGMLQVILHVTGQAHPPQRITQPSVLSVEAEKPTRNPHTSVLPSVGAFISRGAQQYELLVSRSQLASNGSNVLISSS